jgi:hypothetical protein
VFHEPAALVLGDRLAGVDAAFDGGGFVAVRVGVVLAAGGGGGHAAERVGPLLFGGCGGGQVGGAAPGQAIGLQLGHLGAQGVGIAGVNVGHQGLDPGRDAGPFPGELAVALVPADLLAVLERLLELSALVFDLSAEAPDEGVAFCWFLVLVEVVQVVVVHDHVVCSLRGR